jgi:SRSO17 transposase
MSNAGRSSVEVAEIREQTEFESYLEELCAAVGRVERRNALRDDARGLLLPLERKRIEPMAAQLDPHPVSAKHQALHHVVANADGSDEAVLAQVRSWVLPELNLGPESDWIVDDTGLPQQGPHSVGVAHP